MKKHSIILEGCPEIDDLFVNALARLKNLDIFD